MSLFIFPRNFTAWGSDGTLICKCLINEHPVSLKLNDIPVATIQVSEVVLHC